MKRGFKAGCALEVTLKFAEFENMKPSFWAGISEEYDASEGDVAPSREELLEKVKDALSDCREIVEERIDSDIYDVKQVKIFEQINYKRKRKDN